MLTLTCFEFLRIEFSVNVRRLWLPVLVNYFFLYFTQKIFWAFTQGGYSQLLAEF